MKKARRISKRVYFIGAGPGRSDLITVRGLNILKEADTVIYDYLVDKTLLENTKEDTELICSDRLGKRKGFSDNSKGDTSRRITNLIVKRVKQGRRVVRLKNGDPSIFSRLSQELEALVKEEINFEIVPGVTATTAAASFSAIPLTDRKFASSCCFVTGCEDPGKKNSLINWENIAKSSTLVLYMAVGNLERIVKQLIKSGRDKDTAVVIVENISLPTQRILSGTLDNIVKKAKSFKLRPPATIIIGEVAGLKRRFNRLNKNKRILFTGLSRERYFQQGIYFHLPFIKIKPMEDYREFDNYLKNIRNFNWIVFSSRYGVEYFFKRLKDVGYDSRVLNSIKIAAIGNSTKSRLLDFGILADLVPRDESACGLIEKFKNLDLRGKKIFMPRSDISDKGLSEGLQRQGAEVTTSFAYRNVMPDNLPDLNLKFFHEIIFTSPSAVRNFKKRYSAKGGSACGGKIIPKHIKISCIGNVTLREAKRCRLLN